MHEIFYVTKLKATLMPHHNRPTIKLPLNKRTFILHVFIFIDQFHIVQKLTVAGWW